MANDDNQANKILQDTKKILFAEDLVNYMLQKNSLSTIVFSTESNERERKNGVSIFDNKMRIAANYSIVDANTDYLIIYYNLNNIERFHCYAKATKMQYLRSTTYTECFFHYSVYLADLAAKLYAREIKEAPRIAVHYIIEGMDLDRFNPRKAIFVRFGQTYANNQRQSSQDSSSYSDARFATPGLPLDEGESIDNLEQPSPQRKDETYVQAIDLQKRIPHQLDRFNSRKTILDLFGQKYENNPQQSSQGSSSYSDPRFATPDLPLYQGQSIDNLEQPSPQRKDETYVQAIDIEMSIPHQHLKRRKVTAENIHTVKYIGEKAYECVEDQHYVDNKKVDADISMISSYSPFQPLSDLEFEETQKFVCDPPNLNTCNVSSLGPIGVPATSRGKNISLDSPE